MALKIFYSILLDAFSIDFNSILISIYKYPKEFLHKQIFLVVLFANEHHVLFVNKLQNYFKFKLIHFDTKTPEKLPQFDVSFVFCVRAERVETQECGLAFRGLLIVETNFQEAKEFLLFSLLLLLQLSRYCVLCVAKAEYKKKKICGEAERCCQVSGTLLLHSGICFTRSSQRDSQLPFVS